jgi:hypothetical protein
MPGADPYNDDQWRYPSSCARSSRRWWRSCGRPSNRCCRRRLRPTRWAVTGHGCRTGCASGGILIRLVTGSSWVDVEAILDHQVSDTTLRARRDEWIAAGVLEAVRIEALAAFDRIVGPDLDEVALDGSLHKAPYVG